MNLENVTPSEREARHKESRGVHGIFHLRERSRIGKPIETEPRKWFSGLEEGLGLDHLMGRGFPLGRGMMVTQHCSQTKYH